MNFDRVLKSWLLLSCVLRFDVGLAETETNGYAEEVKALFEELTEYSPQVALAKEKMIDFKNETLDRKYAISLINLYTQPGPFYLTLNAEMKNGYPTTTNVWKRAGSLLNRAVDIIEGKLFNLVYRGCKAFDDLPIPGKEYSFHHIIRASQSKETAVSYVKCEDNFLIIIEHVFGISVEKYSHYPKDKEVLIKSSQKFKVVNGPHKEGQYDIYFLSGHARESVSYGNHNDVIRAEYDYAWRITYLLGIVFLFACLLCVTKPGMWPRFKKGCKGLFRTLKHILNFNHSSLQ